MREKFLKVMKILNIWWSLSYLYESSDLEVQWISSRISKNKSTQRHIIWIINDPKDKEFCKLSWENKLHTRSGKLDNRINSKHQLLKLDTV